MNAVTVSIGMPVYNLADHVGEAIESLLAQGHSDFELIISDNASTDSTLEVVESYARKDSRIRVLRQEVNGGAIANFNATLDEAAGDWFMWAAGDDIWSHDWLEGLLSAVAGRDCAAFGVIQVISIEGKPIPHPSNHREFRFTGGRMRRRLKYFMEPSVLGKANPIYGLYPTQLLRELRLEIIEDVPFGADMVYVYELLSRVDLLSVRGAVLRKRYLESSAGEVVRAPASTGIVRLFRPFRDMMKSSLLSPVLKRSRPLEKCLVVCVLPIQLSRIVVAGMRGRRFFRRYGGPS